ncbi:hypothetical protein TI39_contig805g00002 [Zymoseptoria brevis]|uniref:Uncharacterized protein n=1 Tax=Zymoseptoria brevis TaxID=1047168 RepID=A0A0F4GFP9_9PEZI|nr:hypothetical protein TI39_contig805g00002 [Zymoseptoria brevis]
MERPLTPIDGDGCNVKVVVRVRRFIMRDFEDQLPFVIRIYLVTQESKLLHPHSAQKMQSGKAWKLVRELNDPVKRSSNSHPSASIPQLAGSVLSVSQAWPMNTPASPIAHGLRAWRPRTKRLHLCFQQRYFSAIYFDDACQLLRGRSWLFGQCYTAASPSFEKFHHFYNKRS